MRFPDGSLGLYNRMLAPDGVSVVPIWRGRIVLIRRFRHGTGGFEIRNATGIAGEAESSEADAARA